MHYSYLTNYTLTKVNHFNRFENKIYNNSIVLVKAGNVERVGEQR